jgi:catechol 2,3-dioxygenase-like lactoylglutathione lyase family enzyme
MKKIIGLLAALMLLLTAVSFAEGEIVLGQVQYPAHGEQCFAVITVALQDDVIVAAKVDEYQFMSDREDLKAVGVPNSDKKLGESFPEGKVLGSKRVNSDLYSLNMQRAGSTVQIAANFNAIEDFAKGKTVAELEELGIPCEPIRKDTFTSRKMTFFADPDGLPLELHE